MAGTPNQNRTWLQQIAHGLSWRSAALLHRARPVLEVGLDTYWRQRLRLDWLRRSPAQRDYGGAGQGSAGQGLAGQGSAGQGLAGRGGAGQASHGHAPHGLPAPLIISLTSFPGRYDTLVLTLKSLLTQSVRADQVILWIAAEHQAALPPAVLDLQQHGLTIASCDNTLRSHNKYLHTRRRHPGAFIVTADDDTYYWRHWLAELIDDYDPAQRVIPCHRVHTVTLQSDGRPAAYRSWQWESAGTMAGPLVFPTGVGGVLYPPGCLPDEVDDPDRILALCPRADDVWLYWMAQRNGWLFRKTLPWRRLHHWRHSQTQGLMWENVYNANGNDAQIAVMIEAYGWPPMVRQVIRAAQT